MQPPFIDWRTQVVLKSGLILTLNRFYYDPGYPGRTDRFIVAIHKVNLPALPRQAVLLEKHRDVLVFTLDRTPMIARL
jgi:hypothetical protein